jgi:outer membrane protein
VTISLRARLLLMSCLLALPAGCSSYDGKKIREEHAADYPAALRQKTDEILAKQPELGLDDCVRIALANNLDVQTAAIRQRIAGLERRVAFANFLPALSLNAQYSGTDPQLTRQFMGTQIALNDKEVTEVSWQVRLSIFNPSTWFLYGLYSRGEEIAEIVNEYTRQAIVLQTTVLYFQCLSLDQVEKALQSQLLAAEALDKQIAVLRREGLVPESQAAQAALQVQARKTDLAVARRTRIEAKALFATQLGLFPVADFSLRQDLPYRPVERTPEDLVTEALLKQPRLRVADRQIAIEEEKVKLAVANFLPNVMGFAGRVNSSDSFLVHSTYWQYGLAGVLNVFDGFANINTYEAAKEQKKEAFLRREQETLALMVEVTQAYWDLQTASDQAALASRALDVATCRLTEIRPKWNEGLADASTFLSAQADVDRAQMNALNARFQQQISIATLFNVMGVTPVESKESSNDKSQL